MVYKSSMVAHTPRLVPNTVAVEIAYQDGFVVGAACRLGGLAMSNFVVLSEKATIVLYAIPLGAAGVALLLMGTASQPRFSRAISNALGPIAERISAPFSKLTRSAMGTRSAGG